MGQIKTVIETSPEELIDMMLDGMEKRGILPTWPGTGDGEPRFIRGIRKLSARYGSSSATIERLIKNGTIPYRRIGKHYVFSAAEVDEALKNVTR